MRIARLAVVALIAGSSLLGLAEQPAWARDELAYYREMSPDTRRMIQEALIWSGHYEGMINGAIGPSTLRAIERFQRDMRRPPTGMLTHDEVEVLAARAREARHAVGYAAYSDPATGLTVGLPLRLAPYVGQGERGSRFASSDGRVQIELLRFGPDEQSLRGLFHRVQNASPSRQVTYSVLREDWFVTTGVDRDMRFYMRARQSLTGVVAFAITYVEAVAPVIEPIIVAMSNSFADPASLVATTAPAPPRRAERAPDAEPETTGAIPPAARSVPQAVPPEARVAPASALGFAVSPEGHFLTTAPVATCRAVSVGSFGPASVLAVDRQNNLALLKVETQEVMAHGAFAEEAAGIGERVTIAPPETAETPDAASGEVTALAGPDGDSRHLQVSVAPRPDDGGAPVLDSSGRVIGMALPGKPPVTARAAHEAQRPSRLVLRKEVAQLFLTAQGVTPVTSSRSEESFGEDEAAELAKSLTHPVLCSSRRG